MIRVLIAEDSSVVALMLKAIFENEEDMVVVGHAKNGREAVNMAHDLKPDIITMDIRMPEMDGFEATRLIMINNPIPIVVISSSVDNEELRITFRAIEEGALAVLEKPHGLTHPDFERVRTELVETIRSMSEIKVVRRKSIAKPLAPIDIFETAIRQDTKAYELIAIGCSTGGPQVLQHILSTLPVGFPIPILIVQHISTGFVGGLVEWLNGSTLLEVKLAEDDEKLLPGVVYIGPDDYHLQVKRNGKGLTAILSSEEPVNRFRPSVTPLLQSVAEVCKGRGIGGILTGMGADGVQGLLALKQAHGHTFVQDEESAIVYGMPGAAVALGAVDQIVELDKITAYLYSLARR